MACTADDVKVEPIEATTDARPYRWSSLTGVRDGDILNAEAVLVSGQANLTMTMRFRIGVPTRLEGGHFLWNRQGQVSRGRITERSVTFLGGQSDQPSLGGVFELTSDEGARLCKVRLPTRQLSRRRQPLPDSGRPRGPR